MERWFRTPEDLHTYRHALRSGELPPDIDHDRWRRRLRAGHWGNALRLLIAGFLLAVGVLVLVAGRSEFHWVIALAMQASALWFLFLWWASRSQLTVLAVAVEQRAVRQTWG